VHAAARQDHVEVVRPLCKLGANVDTQNKSRQTPVSAVFFYSVELGLMSTLLTIRKASLLCTERRVKVTPRLFIHSANWELMSTSLPRMVAVLC
jgi:hypothetical protein